MSGCAIGACFPSPTASGERFAAARSASCSRSRPRRSIRVQTIGAQIQEALHLHFDLSASEARARAKAALQDVGFPDPDRGLEEYPHRLSGGLRQRAFLALALAGGPALLLADEPTASLDATVAAQVLDLLDRLRRERGLTLLLITHDLGAVAQHCDRVLVLYAGRIVEEARTAALFRAPCHPYTRGLLRSVPRVASAARERGRRYDVIPGLVADLLGADGLGLRLRAAVRGAVRALRREAARALHDRIRPGPLLPLRRRRSRESPLTAPAAPDPLLSVRGLTKRYAVQRSLLGGGARFLAAVSGVDFDVRPAETLALVGESGSGKTTIGRIVARLVEPDAGEITFEGEDWLALSGKALRRRRRDLQVVFQDPQTSLNPRMRVDDQIAEPLRVQGLARGVAREGRVRRLLEDVGLPSELAARFPAELSGGQRQRVAIARALATEPRLLVCDEPVSALDVSIAAQIVNLLLDLKERTGLAYLFIAHDLAVVSRIADVIAVLYLGRIVEHGPREAVLGRPLHPYTVALLAAVPDLDPGARADAIRLAGDPPSAADPPSGCAFHPRCPIARPRCREERPTLRSDETGRSVACFYPGEMQ